MVILQNLFCPQKLRDSYQYAPLLQLYTKLFDAESINSRHVTGKHLILIVRIQTTAFETIKTYYTDHTIGFLGQTLVVAVSNKQTASPITLTLQLFK